MKMVAHQAIAVKLERLPLLEICYCLQERPEVALLMKHVLAVIAAVDDMVD